MATYRYGTSLGPAAVRSVTDVQPNMDEDSVKPDDPADPNRLLQCPYDKNHQIRAGRFPFHLLKCKKNHPKLASELITCPFNAKHLMPKDQLSHHIEICEDRRCVSPEEDEAKKPSKFVVPLSTWTRPVSEEDWDKEADDNAATFVWGVSTNPLTRSLNHEPQ